MARPLRIDCPGAVYHITSRGNESEAVFKGDQDCVNFLNALQHVNKRNHWSCHTCCLMDNHVRVKRECSFYDESGVK